MRGSGVIMLSPAWLKQSSSDVEEEKKVKRKVLDCISYASKPTVFEKEG